MDYTMTTHMNYRKEHIIYTSIWLMLYLSPLASLYMRMSSNPNIAFSWHEILNAWAFNTIWLVLMLIHNFLLLPVLIIKRARGSIWCCLWRSSSHVRSFLTSPDLEGRTHTKRER